MLWKAKGLDQKELNELLQKENDQKLVEQISNIPTNGASNMKQTTSTLTEICNPSALSEASLKVLRDWKFSQKTN